MARIPKGDAPQMAYFFLLLCLAGLVVFGVGVGLLGLQELLSHWIVVASSAA